MDISKICSARQAYEVGEAERAEQEHKRQVDAATLDLNKQAKNQTEVARAQLSEVQKTNELLVKQAEDAKRFAEKADNRSIISIGIAGTSLLVAVISLIKGC